MVPVFEPQPNGGGVDGWSGIVSECRHFVHGLHPIHLVQRGRTIDVSPKGFTKGIDASCALQSSSMNRRGVQMSSAPLVLAKLERFAPWLEREVKAYAMNCNQRGKPESLVVLRAPLLLTPFQLLDAAGPDMRVRTVFGQKAE